MDADRQLFLTEKYVRSIQSTDIVQECIRKIKNISSDDPCKNLQLQTVTSALEILRVTIHQECCRISDELFFL